MRSRPGQGAAPKSQDIDGDTRQSTADEACDACGHPPPYDDAGSAWHLAWQLVGLPDPLPLAQWRQAIGLVVDAHGAQTAARGLELAAQQPSMAPLHPDAPRARWWLDEDRQRAAALAVELRGHAKRGVADAA